MTRSHRFSRLVLLAACLLLAPFARAIPDPAAPGPFAVTRAEYTLGDTAFQPTDFVALAPAAFVEITASVHYPTGLPGGPYPLILLMHGRHSTAYNPTTGQAFSQWPPSAGRLSIPSYRGYDYTSEILASHGYIVVSVSANGINARDNGTTDRGARARAELIQTHLNLWRTFATTGGAPFGTTFAGKVDLGNIGTMGHSRGGEGVVRHYLYNQAQGSPYTVNAVFPIAPVDYNRPVINNVPLFLILPYADGDVRDLQGIHFFDDARYSVPGDAAPKYFVTIMGANHNYYNTYWTPTLFAPGSSDDWQSSVLQRYDPYCSPTVPGNARLTPEQQQGTGLAYMSAFFRAYIGGETEFLPFLRGDVAPPPSAATTALMLTYHAPDQPNFRRDVNRLTNTTHLTLNTGGGAVTQDGLTPYDMVGGDAPQPYFALPGQPAARQPGNTPALFFPQMRGLNQLRIGWSAPTAFYANALPPGQRNVSGYYALQFRVAVNFTDYRNAPNQAQDFSVVLTDGLGRTASTRVSQWSSALLYPPGKIQSVPKVILNMVRIPLSAFAGVDRTDIRSIRFQFDQRTKGALLLSDIAFVDPA